MTALAAVSAALAGAGAVWALVALTRDPDRWPWMFRQQTWLRVLAWTVALTAAAVLGAVLGGSVEVVAVAIAVGACLAFAAVRFWADANEDDRRA